MAINENRDDWCVVLPIQRADDVLEHIFSRGLHQAGPVSYGYQFATGSTLSAP